MPTENKTTTAGEISKLLSSTFSAVIFQLLPGGGGYELHVISAQDHDTADDEYVKIASCAIGLGAVAEAMTAADFFRIAMAIETGGSVTTGLSAVSADENDEDDEDEGPFDLASMFRMQTKGRA